MDLATLLGFVMAWIAFSVQVNETGVGFGAFFDGPSIMFVLFGSMFITMMRNSLKDFGGMWAGVGRCFFRSQPKPLETVQQFVEFAGIVRRDGVIALQNQEIDDPFMQKAVNMVVDGFDEEVIETSLTTEMAMTRERDQVSVKMLNFWAEVAPAFGMVGTMIGLVAMLKSMDNLDGIGGAFAIALLTTMWGAITAYMVAKPMAEKLDDHSKIMMAANMITLEGALHLKKGTNPRIVSDILSNRLAPKARAELAENN